MAIHPDNPRIIAVGVNGGHTTGAAVVDEGARAEPKRLNVYVTEDGGATWRGHRVPLPTPANASARNVMQAGDPALAFDGNGTLHVTGMASNDPAHKDGYRISVPGFMVFYTSTPDLGRSWTEPVVLAGDSDNDRNWLTIGPGGGLYASWQNAEESTEVAWSVDGGETWRQQTRDGVAKGCTMASPVVFSKGEPLVACAGVTANGTGYTGVEVHWLDTDTGRLGRIAHIKDLAARWPRLLSVDGGGLLVVAERNGTAYATTSWDDGSTWRAPVDVRGLATVEDAWDWLEVYWFVVDPWGVAHLLVVGESRADGAQGAVDEREHVAHLTLDPADLSLVSEHTLTTTSTSDGRRAPPSLAPGSGDDYYGLAFAGDHGFLAWTRDKGIDYTIVRPVWAEDGGAE